LHNFDFYRAMRMHRGTKQVLGFI